MIANPPYAKHPARLLDECQRERFARTTYGHPNLYGLFLQIGVELLAEHGRLAFITPSSLTSGLYFRKLRRFLADELELQQFISFSGRSGLFDGVLQGVLIMIGERRLERSAEIELLEFAGPPSAEPVASARVARDSVLLGDSFDRAFFIAAEPRSHQILEKMTRASTPLGELGYQAVTGTIVWNRLKQLIRDEHEPGATRPLIWGNGIRWFRFAGLGNRAGQASQLQLTERTRALVATGDALVIKRLTAKEEPRRIVACRLPAELATDPDGYFAENHVNLLRERSPGSAQVELDAVLGLLNSKLYDFIFRALNGNTQVSASELEMLPVRTGPELGEIAAAAVALSAAAGNDPAARARLDRAVYELYRLDPGEIALIEG